MIIFTIAVLLMTLAKIVAVSAALLLATPCLAAPSIDETFTFIGDCADCAGTSSGSLVVTAAPGQTSFSLADFVSFSYSSSLIPTVVVTDPSLFTATFTTLPGPNDVGIDSGDFRFETFTSGFWCIGFSCGLDYGEDHVWSAPVTTPEPASLALLALPIAALTATRRRRAG